MNQTYVTESNIQSICLHEGLFYECFIELFNFKLLSYLSYASFNFFLHLTKSAFT